jgi:hypothetical protein
VLYLTRNLCPDCYDPSRISSCFKPLSTLVVWILRGKSSGTVTDSSVNPWRLLLCQFDSYLNPDPHIIFDIYWFVIFWVGCMQGLVYVHCFSYKTLLPPGRTTCR